MSNGLLKKINMCICSILLFYIIFAVIYTTNNFINNNILAYLFDLFIAFEVYWILEEFLKEKDEKKQR